MSIPEDLELFTLAEVSAVAKRHRKTLDKDVAAGRLHIVKIGGSTRVTRPELERFLSGDGPENRQTEDGSSIMEAPVQLPRRKS